MRQKRESGENVKKSGYAGRARDCVRRRGEVRVEKSRAVRVGWWLDEVRW